MKILCVAASLSTTEYHELVDDISELKKLCETLNYKVLDTVVVPSSKIHSATFISKPFANDIKSEVDEKKAEIVVFNENLSPAQLKNLENIWEVPIIDRTELILKIFEIHARSQEAKIQVEIARLKYTLPRLKRMWTHLSRIEGGIGYSKGKGETQIETDRRIISKQISKLTKKLKTISTRREVRIKQRLKSKSPLVSLVGYTNAGKTSLLNLLANEKLLAEDKFFATLSPVTRKVFLKHNQYALVSDTVGFIKKLPPHLVASFRSTLKEIQFADIILLLQDITHPHYKEQISIVTSILGEIEVLDKPIITVFSKIDLIQDPHALSSLRRAYPNAIFISSITKEGIDQIKQRILKLNKKDNLTIKRVS